jgi:DNA-directed RNA polymerase subunit M/transcription elongation factor TFIIS
MYNIIMCYNCGRLLIAKSAQKTRQCPHCEARINPERARLVASTKTAKEASELIRTLKQKKEATED